MRKTFFWAVDHRHMGLAFGAARHLRSMSGGGVDFQIFLEDPSASSGHVEGIGIRANALESSLSGSLPASRRWPAIVYGRLFGAELLSRHYDRAVYLDADMTFTGPLDEIFGLDLGGSPVAAVRDSQFLDDALSPGFDRRAHAVAAGIDLNRYMNSGFLLLDLAHADLRDLGRALHRYMAARGARAPMQDQDFLNHRFARTWREISPRWNFQTPFMGLGLEAVVQPKVIHFTGHLRPWHALHYPFGREHVAHFRRLLRNSFAGATRPPPVARNRYKIAERLVKQRARALLHHIGFATPKVRAAAAEWSTRRALLLAELADGLARGRFADIVQGGAPFGEDDLKSLPVPRPRYRRGAMVVDGRLRYPE